MVTGDGKGLSGRWAESTGGFGRRAMNRVQGGEDEGKSHGGNRSQGEDKKDL